PAQRVRERLPVRIADRDVVEAGCVARRWRRALRLPGVQPDVMVVAAGRDEGGLVFPTLLQLEAEHADVEVERAVEIRHLEVYVADVHAWVDRHARTIPRPAPSPRPPAQDRKSTRLNSS